MQKIRWAMIGVGSMGLKYVKYLLSGDVKNSQLTAVVARNDAKADEIRELASAAGGQDVVIFKSADELFAHADTFDAVLIATPHKSHHELAKIAFARKKHVLCEKPLAVSLKESKEMTEEAKEAGVLLGVCYQQRLFPSHKYIVDAVKGGKLGRIKRAELVTSRYFRTQHYHHSAGWHSTWTGEGGGALINQGQHILDFWISVFGLPESVYADIPFGKYNDFRVDDEATLLMRYPDKFTGVFVITTGEAANEDRFTIVGSKGRLCLEDGMLREYSFTPDSDEYQKTSEKNSREELLVSEVELDLPKDPGPEVYLGVLENFGKAVLNGSELMCDGTEGTKAVHLSSAAYMSAWEGKRVELPINEEMFDDLMAEQIEAEAGS